MMDARMPENVPSQVCIELAHSAMSSLSGSTFPYSSRLFTVRILCLPPSWYLGLPLLVSTPASVSEAEKRSLSRRKWTLFRGKQLRKSRNYASHFSRTRGSHGKRGDRYRI